MGEPVFCPVCLAEGLRSTVTFSYGAVTLMAWQPWYDEDGQYHDHDPNGHGRSGRCSNAHFWHESWHSGCPAGDYGGEVSVTIDVVCETCRGIGTVQTGEGTVRGGRNWEPLPYTQHGRCPECDGKGHWAPDTKALYTTAE